MWAWCGWFWSWCWYCCCCWAWSGSTTRRLFEQKLSFVLLLPLWLPGSVIHFESDVVCRRRHAGLELLLRELGSKLFGPVEEQLESEDDEGTSLRRRQMKNVKKTMEAVTAQPPRSPASNKLGVGSWNINRVELLLTLFPGLIPEFTPYVMPTPPPMFLLVPVPPPLPPSPVAPLFSLGEAAGPPPESNDDCRLSNPENSTKIKNKTKKYFYFYCYYIILWQHPSCSI